MKTLDVWGSQQWLYITWVCSDSHEWQTLLDSFKEYFKEYFPTDRTYEATTRSWSLQRRHRRALEDWADLHFTKDEQNWDTTARKRRTP